MPWSRKAQSGAAILIGLIAVMIVLYVLFLPPQDRAVLLGESAPGTGAPGQTNTLFTSTVGSVYLASAAPQTHSIPGLTIQALEQGSLIASRDTVTAKNNVFEKQPGIILFTMDPAVTRNAMLSTNVRSKTGGNLIIKLNDVEIFNQNVASRTVPPLELTNLKHENKLSFEVSTVGFAFWRSNVYTLNNIRITADVTDLSGAFGEQRFTLSEDEFERMESAVLTFVPICRTEGRLVLSLNGGEIFSGIPDCGTINTFELAPARLQMGENRLSASTSEADVLLDRVTIKTIGEEQENRVFSFSIDGTAVQGRQVSAVVRFSDTNTHRGILYVNNNAIPFNAAESTTIPITSFIRPGANTISFAASERQFEVVSFDVLRN